MEKKQEKKQPKNDEKAEATQEDSVTLSDLEQKELEIALLKEQVETAKADVAEMKDQMLRNRADLENTRKRLIRDKEEGVKYANSALIKDLLEPLDDFSRA
ncbi:MAG: nucleotide exchange factor GrpE, partial [Sphaerochaeta sp.]